MCAVARRVIGRRQLVRKEVTTVDALLLKDNYILLKGTVYTPDGEILPNAAIDIIQTNTNVIPPVTKEIGVTFSMEDGSYGITIPWEKGYYYELILYSPWNYL